MGAIGEFYRIFGWEAILVAILAVGVVFLSLIVFLVYAAAKYKVPSETKTPFFYFRVGGAPSPNSAPEVATERLSTERDLPPIAKELRNLCLERRIRKRDLARVLNVTAASISHMEAGIELPSPDQIERIISEFALPDRQAKKLRAALRRSRVKKK
jgi:hypothetical protein